MRFYFWWKIINNCLEIRKYCSIASIPPLSPSKRSHHVPDLNGWANAKKLKTVLSTRINLFSLGNSVGTPFSNKYRLYWMFSQNHSDRATFYSTTSRSETNISQHSTWDSILPQTIMVPIVDTLISSWRGKGIMWKINIFLQLFYSGNGFINMPWSSSQSPEF